MAAHTYWRLYIGAMSNVYAQIGTVSFLNAAQVNQSTGGTATASSEYDGSWAAGNAFDGNPASEWASAATSGPEWIAYQHPSPVDIVLVGVKVSTSYPVSGLALQYSDDGVSWSAASPLHVLAGQPALDSGSYTVLGTGTSRRPLVLVDGWIEELPDGDTLPPQAPAAHSHATSDVTGLDAALSGKEPTISAGTTAQYWRGNKTWRDFFTDVRAATLTGLSTATNAVITAADTVLAALGKLQAQITAHTGSTSNPHGVTKTQVGLGNVDNTSDANKPISTATQTALDGKAPLASPALTGTPTAPTAAVGTDTTQLATTAHVFAERAATATLTNKTLTTPVLTGAREVRVAMPANAIDLSAGNVFTKTISGATTLTVSNTPTTGNAASFILELTNAGSAAITWFSGVKWAGGTAPTLTAAGVDVLGFYSHDGGTTWRGMMLAKDSK